MTITEETIFDLFDNKTLEKEIEQISDLTELEKVEDLLIAIIDDFKCEFYGHPPNERLWMEINELQMALMTLNTKKMKLNGTYEEWKKEFDAFMSRPEAAKEMLKAIDDEHEFRRKLFGD